VYEDVFCMLGLVES